MEHAERIIELITFLKFLDKNYTRLPNSDRWWYGKTLSHSSAQVAKYFLRISEERNQRLVTKLKSDDLKTYMRGKDYMEIGIDKLFKELGLSLEN